MLFMPRVLALPLSLYSLPMPPLVALVDDLMFLSRIREAARGAGVEMTTARDAEGLLAAARAGARLVLVDLDGSRVPWRDALVALRADPALGELPVVGFLGHVRADLAEAARAAGASRVLARSAFVAELPRLVAALAADAEPPAR
jgi:CheY-like chemotaxis protein